MDGSVSEGLALRYSQTAPHFPFRCRHQFVDYPAPDANGYYVMNPHLRMAFLPPNSSDTLLSEAVLVSYVNSSHRPGCELVEEPLVVPRDQTVVLSLQGRRNDPDRTARDV